MLQHKEQLLIVEPLVIAEGSTQWGRLAPLREYWLHRLLEMWVWELTAFAEGFPHYSVLPVEPCILFLLPIFTQERCWLYLL